MVVSTVYWVEALDKGRVRTVPHTVKGKEQFYQYLSRSDANKFLKDLVQGNPHLQFRLIKRTMSVTETGWFKKEIKTRIWKK